MMASDVVLIGDSFGHEGPSITHADGTTERETVPESSVVNPGVPVVPNSPGDHVRGRLGSKLQHATHQHDCIIQGHQEHR
jgi:hypothetical protein